VHICFVGYTQFFLCFGAVGLGTEFLALAISICLLQELYLTLTSDKKLKIALCSVTVINDPSPQSARHSHTPGDRLPLLSTWPTVTFPATQHHHSPFFGEVP